jgi:hypothetical protein
MKKNIFFDMKSNVHCLTIHSLQRRHFQAFFSTSVWFYIWVFSIVCIQTTSAFSWTVDQAYQVALSRDPDIQAVTQELSVNDIDQKLTSVKYGFRLDSSLTAYRDGRNINEWLIDNQDQVPFNDYLSSRTLFNLGVQFKELDPSKSLELTLLRIKGESLKDRLSRDLRISRFNLHSCFAKLWILQDWDQNLESQKAFLDLLSKTIKVKHRMGLARTADLERITVLQNWFQNDLATHKILEDSVLEDTERLVGKDFSLENWKSCVSSSDYSEILSQDVDDTDILSVRQSRDREQELSTRLNRFDSLNRRWKVSLGGRYYDNINVYEASIDTNGDIFGNAAFQDSYGFSGALLGYNGTFETGFLGFLRIDINLIGDSSNLELKKLTLEKQGAELSLEQNLRGSDARILDLKHRLEISKNTLMTREKNIKILKDIEKLQRRDYLEGRESLEELVRFEIEIGQQDSQFRQDQVGIVDSVRQLMLAINN